MTSQMPLNNVALFDEWVEPYEECIYSTSGDTLNR